MSRRGAREKAFQILFQHDIGKINPTEAFNRMFGQEQNTNTAVFARQLVYGTLEHLAIIDQWISQFCKDWDLDRLASVDRNILRLALYEMLYVEDIPLTVSINEAIELVKNYNSEEAARFVNGLLDNVKKNVDKPPTPDY